MNAPRGTPGTHRREPTRPPLWRCAALLLAGVAVVGCPGRDPGPLRALTGQLHVVWPEASAVLTRALDRDAEQEGLQVQVQVGAVGLAEGTLVELRVDTLPTFRGTAPLVAGVALVDVSLPMEPGPDGKVHRLRVSAAQAPTVERVVRTLENVLPACTLEGLTLGGTVRGPGRVPGSGVWLDVAAHCVEGLPATSVDARLEVVQTGAGGSPFITAEAPWQEGLALFEQVLLPEGSLWVRLLAHNHRDALVLLEGPVDVDTGGCDAWPLPGTPRGMLNASNTQDARLVTEALDQVFEVGSARCPQGQATLWLDDVPVDTWSLDQGVARGVVEVPQGAHTVWVSVVEGATPRGDSAPWGLEVDLMVGCPVWVWPPPDARLGPPWDAEDPPNPTNGLSLTVRGAAAPSPGPWTVGLVARGPQGEERTAETVVDAQGAFAWTLTDLAAGTWTLGAVGTDAAGNRCPRAGAPAQARRFEVTTQDTPGVTLSLLETPPANGLLGAPEDVLPLLPGMQAAVVVQTAGDWSVGTRAWVSIRLQDGGGPSTQGFAEVENRTATVFLDVPAQGRFWADAWLVDASGSQAGVYAPQALAFDVDTQAPAVAFLYPETAMELGSGTVTVQLLAGGSDVVPALARLDVEGVPFGPPQVRALGVLVFADVPLRGSADGRYTLGARVPDAAGNVGTATAQVRVVLTAPVPVLTGVDANGDARALEPQVESGPQPRTLLDIRTAQGLAELDYNANAADGLQYGFAVELPEADCANLDAPQARVRVSGIADEWVAALQPVGAVCRGVANNQGLGITLPEGEGGVEVVVRDAAGNVGARRYHYLVRRRDNYVRIVSPTQGARVGSVPFAVNVETDLVGEGACQLLQDGSPQGLPQPLAGMVALGPAVPPAQHNAASILVAVCTVTGGTPSESLPVTVERDTEGPQGTRLTLASGAAVPAYFNLAVSTDGPRAHPRFFKDLAVETRAEVGGCGRLAQASLQVVPQMGDPVLYAPRVSAAGAWVYFPGTGQGTCRAVFPQVDLGAAVEPGLTHALEVTATDAAGNPSTPPALVRLTDREKPLLQRLAPAAPVVVSTDDAAPGVAGVQIAVEVGMVPDGRPATAVLSCTSPLVCAERTTAVEAGAQQLDFAAGADAPTFEEGAEGRVGSWRAVVTDEALNVSVLEERLWLQDTAPTVTWEAPTGPLLVASDAQPSLTGWQGTARVQVAGCGVEGVPGQLALWRSTTPVGLPVPVDSDGVLEVPLSLPHARGQVLEARCTNPGPWTGSAYRTLDVDVLAPAVRVPTVSVVSARSGRVQVRFVAPGDDGAVVPLPATAYRVWWVAPPVVLEQLLATPDLEVPINPPHAPGTMESFALSVGFSPEPRVLALVTTDALGNRTLAQSAPVPLFWGGQETGLVLPADSVMGPRAGPWSSPSARDVPVGLPKQSAVRMLHLGGAPVVPTFTDLPAGPAGSGCGQRVMMLGDLNQDGLEEVLATCPAEQGRAYLWFGAPSGMSPEPLTLQVSVGSQAPLDGVPLGHAAAVADVNGDGAADLALYAPHTTLGVTEPRAWVILGDGTLTGLQTGPSVADLDALLVAGRAGRLVGAPGSGLGQALLALPGQGVEPGVLVAGAPGELGSGDETNPGAVWWLPGSAALAGWTDPVSGWPGAEVHVGQTEDRLGGHLAVLPQGVAVLARQGGQVAFLQFGTGGWTEGPRLVLDQPAQTLATAALVTATADNLVLGVPGGVEVRWGGQRWAIPGLGEGAQFALGDWDANGNTDLVAGPPGSPLLMWR